MVTKEELLKSLNTDIYLSTNEIKDKCKIHWYHASKLLTDLLMENKVERMIAGKSTFWRLKDGKRN